MLGSARTGVKAHEPTLAPRALPARADSLDQSNIGKMLR